MNKHAAITVIAAIVIIIPFAHSGFNILGAQQLEYRWYQPDEFSFFAMSNHGDVEFCNTMPFWSGFHKFEMGAFYDTKHLGSFIVGPSTVNPLSSTTQKGVFSTEEFSAAQHIFMTMDFQFDGGNIRLDPNRFLVVTEIDTPVLGIIPYSLTTQTSGFDLDEMMSAEDWSCD